MPVPDEQHSWFVDAIEEGVAAILEDGERLLHVPVWMLPDGTAEGDRFTVMRDEAADARAVVRIAREAAPRESRRERPRNPRDRGGDIAL